MSNFFNDIFGLFFMIELDYLRFTYEIIFIIIGQFFFFFLNLKRWGGGVKLNYFGPNI
jgi:hypothetical protein